MPLSLSRILVAGATTAAASVALAALFRHALLEQHGVATTLLKYLRLRYKLRHGFASILTLADFDRTITTKSCDVSCHGVVESCEELSERYRAETQKLFDHYYPIETHATMPVAEKIPLMQSWYRQAHTLLLREPFTPELLDSATKRSTVALRPGFDELEGLLRAHGTPLVVCSAGLGNVVRAVFKHRLRSADAILATARMPIVSNWLEFDASGRVSGFTQPLLHMVSALGLQPRTSRPPLRLVIRAHACSACPLFDPRCPGQFNKNGEFVRAQLGEARWQALVGSRRVCLLLGDGIGDATMADGLGMATVKIGFLNETDEERVSARLPQYEAAFDAVILGDRSFDWLLTLLRGLA